MNQVSGPSTDERHLLTLGRLTRGALHEISNPLLALVGSAELALTEVEPGSKGAGRVATIRETGLEITEIVRALQRFARQRAEPARRFSLAEAAEEAATLVRLVGATPDVEIVVRAEADPRVHEPPGPVSSALVELLLDALGSAARGDRVELVVREEQGQGVASVTGGDDARFRVAGAE